MELRKLDLFNDSEIAFIENLNIESFPYSERRIGLTTFEFWRDNPNYSIDLAIINGRMTGFISYWNLQDFVFVEHFAIVPDSRNNGIGGEVMTVFLSNVNNPVVLEVELPSTILSERRIGFYQRLGFRLWDDIPYLQPSYHNEGNPIPMKLMSIGNIDLKRNFVKIKDRIYSEVYNS